MPFFWFSPSNAQTKVQTWINSQKFRALSKNYLIFQESAKWALFSLGQQIFLMAISDKAKITIQTASFGVAAPKQKVESGGTGGRGEEVAWKRNWVKLIVWVNMKLKLPLNEVFSPQLVSAADEPQNTHFIQLLHLSETTHSRRDDLSSCCVVGLWLKLVNSKCKLISVLSCSMHAFNAHLWCVPTQYMWFFT